MAGLPRNGGRHRSEWVAGLRWNQWPASSEYAALLICAGLAGCATYKVQEDNWFRPGALPLESAALAGLELPAGFVAEPVAIMAADDTVLRGLHVHRSGPRPTVFYLGGDSFMIARQGLAVAAELSRQGMDVFMLDYRGYGGSEGTPSITALMADAEIGLAYLRRTGAATVIVHGVSMGSFVGAELAVRQPIEGLVLESTATSVRDWADHQVPWYGKPVGGAHRIGRSTGVAEQPAKAGPLPRSLAVAGWRAGQEDAGSHGTRLAARQRDGRAMPGAGRGPRGGSRRGLALRTGTGRLPPLT